MRIEIFYRKKYKDGRATRIKESINKHLGMDVCNLRIIDVYVIENCPLDKDELAQIFTDPVAQEVLIDKFAGETDLIPNWNILIEVAYKTGVTNTAALTAKDAIKNSLPSHVSLPQNLYIQTAQQYILQAGPLSKDSLSKNEDPLSKNTTQINRLLNFLHNPLIQNAALIKRDEWDGGSRPPMEYPWKVEKSKIHIKHYNLEKMGEHELQKLSKQRLLALTTREMKTIKKEFSKPGVKKRRKQKDLAESITDVELEMLAQTWSEHCKHKIFQANIIYKEGNKRIKIKSLFKTYITNTTKELSKLSNKKEFLKSVFHDNSGVIRFDDKNLICFKVETHNSPSALDPYGGAITGIVGVNRDIMGTGKGARPIFNTNVLCFAHPDTPASSVPAGLLHPRQVMEGVHHGIIDGGNQSGIPVVGGAFLFCQSYLGKPLVFCGTGGILPYKINDEESWIKHIDPGDLAVMVGGKIGKDGIHGATFSSRALDEESPTSAVQIGDPIIQKKMLDFLLEARDLGLYKGITDNGAGGLASSLGEMALLSGGVRIELDKCPLKYPGLAPWEILISESQERMSLAISPDTDTIEKFLALANRRDVEAAVVGEFTNTGDVEILYNNKLVGMLSCDFLHNGLPVMELEAVWDPPRKSNHEIHKLHRHKIDRIKKIDGKERDIKGDLLKLLSDPNIASKESLIRQYDHEVQALSVIKPFAGVKADGPTDGAVLRPRLDTFRGITITHGICPGYSDYDTYHMAMCAVDEAFRAHISCGGNPDEACALDNFCWPDPLVSDTNPDAKYKLAQLVRACCGLKDACLAYGLPLISGKDSMKNDAFADGKKFSVKPTLLMSLIGIINDIRLALTTDFKHQGDYIFILGQTRGELKGSSYEKLIYTETDEIRGMGKTRGIGENSNIDKISEICGGGPVVYPKTAMQTYRALYKAIQAGLVASCHDLSDGGMGIALCECSLGGRLGADINLDSLTIEADTNNASNVSIISNIMWKKSSNTSKFNSNIPKKITGMETERMLFCETPSRFLISVREDNVNRITELFNNFKRSNGNDHFNGFNGFDKQAGISFSHIGRVISEQNIRIKRKSKTILSMGIDEIDAAWKSPI